MTIFTCLVISALVYSTLTAQFLEVDLSQNDKEKFRL